MAFPFTEDTIINFLQKGVTQNQIDDTVSGLRSKIQNICGLVVELKPALCAKENNIRLIGTQFFVEILKCLSSNDLNEDEVQVIWSFFTDRLNDHHSIIPTILSGGLILCKNYISSKKCLAEFFTKLFQCIVCQTQKREDREKIFEMLKIASESKLDDIEKLGADWIYGVINAIEGERDPRNLILIFKFMPQLIRNYSLYHLSEEAFEVFAVYFPIDFTQSDPTNITRDLLAEYLEDCLCSSSEFLDSCVELVLEKISSDLKTAKKDSLKLLIKLSKNSSSVNLGKHFKSLWDSIKGDILSGQNNEIKELILITIECLMANLSQDNQTCQNALNVVLAETMFNISDIDSYLFENSFDIVCSCLGSSNEAALFIVPKVLPLMISHYKNAFISQKSKTLKCIESVCALLDKQKIVTQLNNADLDLLQNEVMYIVVHENDPTILLITLQIIQNIVNIMYKENRLIIYSKLIDLAGDLNYCKIIPCLSDTITIIDSRYPNEVPTFVLDELKVLATTQINTQPMKLLIDLMFVKNFNENLNQFIYKRILGESRDNLQFECLGYLVEVLSNNKESLMGINICSIEDIVSFIQNHPQLSSEFLKNYSILLEIAMKNSEVEEQNKILFKFLSQLEPQKKTDLYILSGFLGHVNTNAHLKDHFEQLTQNLIELSILTTEKDCQMICNYLLCSLFNKVPDDNMDKVITKCTLDSLVSEIRCQKRVPIEVFSWISKALLMRGYFDYGSIIDVLIDLLNEPPKSNLAVTAFEIVTLDIPQVHLPFVMNLFKQKLWSYVTRKLEHQMHQLSDEHVTVLIMIMNILPLTVLKIDIQKAGPILIKALTLDHRCVLMCLNILNKLKECNEYFSTYVSNIVPKLLGLAKSSLSMKIRIGALECLYNLTDLPTYTLLPHKDDVTYGIVPVLDDTKRLVRNAASKTRLKWCLIGVPEDL